MTRLYSFIISIFLFSWVLSAQAEGDYVYKKVTDNKEIVDGGTYVFVVNSNGSFWYYGATLATSQIGAIQKDDIKGDDFWVENAFEFSLSSVSDGKFHITTVDSGGDKCYFHISKPSSSYNLLINTGTPGTYKSSVWSVGIDSDCHAIISANDSYSFRYYSSGTYFRYVRSSSDQPIYLYRKYSTKAQAEKVSVGECGWGTLCCDKALDFSSTEIEAYAAALSGTDVILTKLTVVPANCPVILYSANGAKEEDVPVSASNPEAVATVLSGVTDNFVVPSSGTYYVLSTLDGITGFYKAAAGTNIPKGKAYIADSNETSSAKYLSFRLPTATTVTAPFELQSSDDAIYTITGQRVSSSYKGIIIKNKRKVIF